MGEPKRRSQSKSRPRQDRRGWQSRSRRRNESRPPKDKSPHDSSHLCSWRLSTPPRHSQDNVSEEPKVSQMEPLQTAFRDAMESAHSSSLSWEEQVQEEEQQHKGAAQGGKTRTESNLKPDVPPQCPKGGVLVMFP